MGINEIATKADLEKLRSEIVGDIIELMKSKPFSKKKWLTTKEVSEILGISIATVNNYRAKGLLKPRKIEGRLFFSADEIGKLLG